MSRASFQYVLSASILLFPLVLSSAGCSISAAKDEPVATPAVESSMAEMGCCASRSGSESQPALSDTEAAASCCVSAAKDGPVATSTMGSSKTEAGCCASRSGAASQPDHSDTEADTDVSAEFAKLPAADRALAEKQKVCPVTGAPLGSMGLPTKVTLKGRTVFLCCGGCEKKLNKDADKYLAKLDQAGAK